MDDRWGLLPHTAVNYAIALTALAAAVLARWLLDPWLGETRQLVTLYGAVLVAVCWGGYRAGLFVTIAGYAICAYLFLAPRGRLGFADTQDLVGFLAYLCTCLVIIAMGEAMRAAQRRFLDLAQLQERLLALTGPSLDEIRRTHSTRSLTAVGFVLALLVLVIGGVFGFVSVEQLVEDERLVAQSHQMILELETLLSTLKDAETGQRGYLLTQDETYLEPYAAAVAQVRKQIALLKSLSSQDSGRESQIDALEPKVAAKIDEFHRTVTLAKDGDRTAALDVVLDNTGKALMDDIRQEVAALDRAEEDLLRQRTAEAAASRRAARLSIIVSATLGVGLLGLVFYSSQRNLVGRRAAAEALAEQRERLRVTLASIGDAVITTDIDGRITSLNAVAESLTGWTANEASGQPLDAVVHILNSQTRKTIENPANRALRKGAIVAPSNHSLLVRKDSTERRIDESASPIRDSEGRIIGCVLVIRDLSER
jgi:PAS domain S-box-containing protein